MREGIEILSQHPRLPEIIDETTLNRESISTVDDKYISPALKLLTQRAGYELLLKYPEIASKIHENTINNMDWVDGMDGVDGVDGADGMDGVDGVD